MPEYDYANCSVLLFDPVGPNMSSTRAILKGLGFDRVDGVREFQDFSRFLCEGHYPLVIAEMAESQGEMSRLIRRLRGGELGVNIFSVVILTSWSGKESDVAAGVDCGADDVLLRPFSPSGLKERVDTFTRKRKPFIVTGEYIGPDRRKDPQSTSALPLIDTPNALRLAAVGDYEALRRHDREVHAAIAAIGEERVKRLVIRIAAGAKLRLAGESINEQIANEDMQSCTRELRRRLRETGAVEASEIATGLSEIVARVIEDEAAADEQLEMIADLPLKALGAALGEGARDSAAREIERVLSILTARKRRAAVA